MVLGILNCFCSIWGVRVLHHIEYFKIANLTANWLALSRCHLRRPSFSQLKRWLRFLDCEEFLVDALLVVLELALKPVFIAPFRQTIQPLQVLLPVGQLPTIFATNAIIKQLFKGVLQMQHSESFALHGACSRCEMVATAAFRGWSDGAPLGLCGSYESS